MANGRRTVRGLIWGAAALGTLGLGIIGQATVASAAVGGATGGLLSVTLQSADGGSAVWDAHGDPVLTVGSDSSGTYAEVVINDVAGNVVPPVSGEPTFKTTSYAAGSPRWVIGLSNGKSLIGYPSQQALTNGQAPDPGGMAWEVDNDGSYSNTYTNYSTALTDADVMTGTTVTSAYIVADGDQTAGTSDTLTDILLNGSSIPDGGAMVVRSDYSGKCLDVRNGDYNADGVLQQWTCNASYNGVPSADQRFAWASVNGTTVLQALSATTTGGPFFVTANAAAPTAHLTLQAVGSAGDQAITRFGSFIGFPDASNVMDDSGFSMVNGTYVITHAQNTGSVSNANQQWTLVPIS